MRTSNLTRIFGWDMVQATVPIMWAGIRIIMWSMVRTTAIQKM